MRAREKKKRTLKLVCASACVGALLAMVIGNAATHAAKTRAIYRQGVVQIAAGEYEQAIETLEPLEQAGHQGAKRQTYLATAYKEYEEENISGAYWYMKPGMEARA